jgi:hypothetical protein
MKMYFVAAALVIAAIIGSSRGIAQQWSIGGNMGLSVLGGSAGFHTTPMAEYLFNRHVAVGSELSINTQYGAPLIWYPYFKYYMGIQGSPWRPYASAGPLLAFNVPNGPCFGFLFGAGVNIPVARRLYLAPDVVFGPVYGFGGGAFPFILRGYYWGIETYGLTSIGISGVTVFTFSVRGGIRYEM